MSLAVHEICTESLVHFRRPPEITVMVCAQTNLIAKGLLAAKEHKLPFLSWIVDVYIQIPWPHCISRTSTPLLLRFKFTIIVYRM